MKMKRGTVYPMQLRKEVEEENVDGEEIERESELQSQKNVQFLPEAQHQTKKRSRKKSKRKVLKYLKQSKERESPTLPIKDNVEETYVLSDGSYDAQYARVKKKVNIKSKLAVEHRTESAPLWSPREEENNTSNTIFRWSEQGKVRKIASVTPNVKDDEYLDLGVIHQRNTSKQKAKQKWTLLKNTMRFKNSISNPMKVYEVINENLLNECKVRRRSRYSLATANCILDDPTESNDLEKYKNNLSPGNIYREHRNSIQSQKRSKILIRYFIQLSEQESEEKCFVDFGFLEAMLTSGVDVNVTDKHGQSVLHEVARVWSTDVAQFFLDHGM